MCLFVVWIVLAAGCSATTSPEFALGEGPLLRSRAVHIQRALVSVDRTELIIEFIGGPAGDVLEHPCNTEYELDVDGQPPSMSVTVWELEPTVQPQEIDPSGPVANVCNAGGLLRELRHRLTGPPPSELVDGAARGTIPVIWLTESLSVSTVPEGWSAIDTGAPPEPVSVTTIFTDGESQVFVRTTLLGEPQAGDGSRPASLPEQPAGTTMDVVTLRDGGTAQMLEAPGDRRQVRFIRGSHIYDISATTDVPASVLVMFADSLK